MCRFRGVERLCVGRRACAVDESPIRHPYLPGALRNAAASATPSTETTKANTFHLSPESRSVTFSDMSMTVGA